VIGVLIVLDSSPDRCFSALPATLPRPLYVCSLCCAAFTRGWDMTLVMLAVTPFLAGMGFAISIFMSRNTSLINKAYGGEGRGSLDWLCGRLPHAVGLLSCRVVWGQLQYCVELQSCRAAGPHCLTHARDHALTACRRLCLRLRPPALPCPADANSIAQQALGNIRTVYAFNGTERTLAAYAASLDEPVRVSLPAVAAVPHAGPAMPPLWTLPARYASPSAPRLLCLLSRHPLPRCDYTAEPSLRHYNRQLSSVLLPPACPFVCRWASARASWEAWWWASQTAWHSLPMRWPCGMAAPEWRRGHIQVGSMQRGRGRAGAGHG
jgi:ABC-type multidrug transport system fused ATPase/permease subunit